MTEQAQLELEAQTTTKPVDSTVTPTGGETDALAKTGEEESPETKPERLLSQEEVNRIVRKERLAAERRAYTRARLEAENERLRDEVAKARGESPTKPKDGKPDPKDYQDWDAYNDAYVEWKVERKLEERAKVSREQGEQAQDHAHRSEYAAKVQERLAAGDDKYEDFREVITAPGVRFTEAMVDALLATDIPEVVAYTIASNPAESRRIASLPLAKQVLEITSLADKLSKPSQTTKAPEPIKPNASAGSVAKALEETTDIDEWMKKRNRELKRTK